MICLNCGHEIVEGTVPGFSIADAYKTTNTSTLFPCRCQTPKPARPCGATNLYHRAHDNCPGVEMEITH